MKILVLSQTFPLNSKDSTAHFMFDFVKGLTQIRQDVTVLLPFHSDLKINSFNNFFKIKTFKYAWPDSLHLLGFGRTLENDQKLRWFVYFLSPLFFLFGALSLYKLVKKEKFDVINAHWILPNGFLGAVVSKLTKIPLVITLPGSDVYLARKNVLTRVVTKFTLNQAKTIVANSPLLLRDLKIKGHFISYGVPINNKIRRSYKKIKVATAGRKVEKKGILLLKDLVPDIKIFTNLSIDNFRKKLLSTDIFISYSIRDSKGNLDDSSVVLLEAMAAGCAVVTTNLPGYKKIIKDGENGLLFDPSNPADLLNAIDKLKKSKTLRHKLGQQAKLTIQKYFIPQKTAQEYIKLYG